MNAPMVRGYCILRALSFVDEYFGSQEGRALKERLTPEFEAATLNLHPNEWCPRECHVEVLRAIATARPGAEAAREVLVRYGESIAIEAHDTFLRLVMGVMTPTLFSKKLPGMWEINHRASGRMEVEMLDAERGRARVRLEGVAGYDHIAPAYEGWIKRGLARLGLRDAIVREGSWTLDTPGPDEVTFEVGWS